METTLCIANLDWIIGWDAKRSAHGYMRHADLVIRGNRIVHVGAAFEGHVDRRIDGAGLMAMPGLIDLHSHAFSMVMEKGYVEDPPGGRIGELQWYGNIGAFSPCPDDWATCTEVGYAELLMSGVTTLVDVNLPHAALFDVAHRSRMRVYLAPMYTSTDNNSMWSVREGREVSYPWARDGGEALMNDVLRMLDESTSASRNGLVRAIPAPAQLETCTPELLRASLAAARERGVPLQVHAAYNVHEFQEITRRHGTTPVKFMRDVGVLAPDVMIAHAILLDHHSSCREWGTRDDLDILARSGATVVHCPTYYARHFGRVLENHGRYRDAGVNLTLGTDTYPHNILEEMRLALLCSRVVSGETTSATTLDMLNAVTINAARALNRTDIGRLAPGTRADVVLVDLSHPLMRPARDPLRSLIHAAAERAISAVYVDGELLYSRGEVLCLNYDRASRRLEEVGARIAAQVPLRHPSGRSAPEIVPLCLPRIESEICGADAAGSRSEASGVVR